jgi:hypothetical protein
MSGYAYKYYNEGIKQDVLQIVSKAFHVSVLSVADMFSGVSFNPKSRVTGISVLFFRYNIILPLN